MGNGTLFGFVIALVFVFIAYETGHLETGLQYVSKHVEDLIKNIQADTTSNSTDYFEFKALPLTIPSRDTTVGNIIPKHIEYNSTHWLINDGNPGLTLVAASFFKANKIRRNTDKTVKIYQLIKNRLNRMKAAQHRS